MRGSLRHPRIEVQVKSWSSPSGSAASWRYRMRAEHFNELAGGKFYLPRYLFLVVVPAESEQYARVAEDALQLHHAGYWASFASQPPVTGAQTVTVDVPRQNLLTTRSLHDLFPVAAPLPSPRHPS